MKILVPWDLFRVGRGSNSASGHSRISPIVDFSHLGDEVRYVGCKFALQICIANCRKAFAMDDGRVNRKKIAKIFI